MVSGSIGKKTKPGMSDIGISIAAIHSASDDTAEHASRQARTEGRVGASKVISAAGPAMQVGRRQPSARSTRPGFRPLTRR
jgi:hypothetical protein